MTAGGPGPVDGIGEVDGPWLTAALAAGGIGVEVGAVTASAIGTGQMADSFRVVPTYVSGAGPDSVVVKIPAADELSRAAGAHGGYANEVRFYTHLAPTVAVAAPECLYAALTADGAGFALVMEDLAPARQGDQIAGCTVAEAETAAINLAGLHGPRWCDRSLFDHEWLNRADGETISILEAFMNDATPGFVERYADRLEPGDADVIETFTSRGGAWGQGPTRTVRHHPR